MGKSAGVDKWWTKVSWAKELFHIMWTTADHELQLTALLGESDGLREGDKLGSWDGSTDMDGWPLGDKLGISDGCVDGCAETEGFEVESYEGSMLILGE